MVHDVLAYADGALYPLRVSENEEQNADRDRLGEPTSKQPATGTADSPAPEAAGDSEPGPEPRPAKPGAQPGADKPATDKPAAAAAAAADEQAALSTLGAPGRRFSRTNPFYLGFVGTIGVLTAWALGNALVSTRSVLVLLVVALYLAIGLNPVVEWCVRRGVRRGFGVLAVVICVLAVFGLMAVAIIPVVTEQITALVDQVPGWLNQLQRDQRVRELDARYDIISRVQSYVANGDMASGLFGGLLGVGRVVFGALSSAFTVLVLTLYFLGSLPHLTHAVYRMVPRSRRARVSSLTDVILDQIGRYVAGQILVAVIAGTVSFVFLSFFEGVREYALALAIVVAVLGLIPIVGGLISSVLVILLGFLTSLSTGIACLAFYGIYQQLENYVIYPRVMQKSVSLPGMVVVVAALIGGSLLGMVGALLAVPTAAAILLIIREVVIPRMEQH